MNINQLKYFISVAEHLSFTKAAELNYISQTAVTQQIKALENILDVRLFTRTKKHVELTHAGIIFLDEAKAIVNRLEEASSKVKFADAGLSGSLNIGFIRGCEQIGLADTIFQFCSQYPNISLSIDSGNFTSLQVELENKKIDVCFNISNLKSNHSVNYKSYKTIPLYVFLPSTHILSNKPTLVRKDLENETLLFLETTKDNEKYPSFMKPFIESGFIPQKSKYGKSMESVVMMVSCELGVAILPQYAIKLFKTVPNITTIPLINDSEQFEIVAYWRKDNSNPRLMNFLQSF